MDIIIIILIILLPFLSSLLTLPSWKVVGVVRYIQQDWLFTRVVLCLPPRGSMWWLVAEWGTCTEWQGTGGGQVGWYSREYFWWNWIRNWSFHTYTHLRKSVEEEDLKIIKNIMKFSEEMQEIRDFFKEQTYCILIWALYYQGRLSTQSLSLSWFWCDSYQGNCLLFICIFLGPLLLPLPFPPTTTTTVCIYYLSISSDTERKTSKASDILSSLLFHIFYSKDA